MRTIGGQEPFAGQDGYKTFVDMVNGMTYAVKESVSSCMSAWRFSSMDNSSIIEVEDDPD